MIDIFKILVCNTDIEKCTNPKCIAQWKIWNALQMHIILVQIPCHSSLCPQFFCILWSEHIYSTLNSLTWQRVISFRTHKKTFSTRGMEEIKYVPPASNSSKVLMKCRFLDQNKPAGTSAVNPHSVNTPRLLWRTDISYRTHQQCSLLNPDHSLFQRPQHTHFWDHIWWGSKTGTVFWHRKERDLEKLLINKGEVSS